jgi:short-subunit dehydrogenase involved in D-alanine esterification of teichoic acids
VTSGRSKHRTRPTKAGLRAFTQALRYQLQDSGIRVIETLPPLVDTPSTSGIHRPKMAPRTVAMPFAGLASFSSPLVVCCGSDQSLC